MTFKTVASCCVAFAFGCRCACCARPVRCLPPGLMNRLSSSAPSPRPTAFRKTSSPLVVSSGPNSSAATTTAIVSRLRRRHESARLDRESLDPWNQFLDVHRRLLSVVDPCRHPWRRSCAMGLTSDALRPRSDAGRGRRSGVEEDAARPRGIQRPCWGELRDVKRPACNAVADRRMLNLRSSCASYAAGAPNRPERRTCLQQAGALRPGC